MAGDGRNRTLRRYLRREVRAYSAHYHGVLETPSGSRSGPELGAIPFTTLAHVGDPAAFVLRPDWSSIARSGDLRLATRVAWGRLLGRGGRVSRGVVDRRFKPVHWVVQDGVPIGSSAADVERLAAMGGRWLGLAGVQPDDVLVGMVPPGPRLDYWQLVLGARHAGLSAIHLPPVPPADQVAALRPTVLAGRPLDLVRVLDAARTEGRPLDEVRTVLALGGRVEAGLRARLAALLDGPGAAVVSAWAPPGVRALWGECREGTGLHTWPEAEVLEVVDPLSGTPVGPGADGEVVWTPLGWRGTVLLRVRTGVFATLVPGPCRSCGWGGPRLQVNSSEPTFLTALDRHAGVSGWQAELRTVDGREELIVFVAPAPGQPVAGLLAQLDEQLSATQYVVLEPAALDRRLSAHDDRRVVDLRV